MNRVIKRDGSVVDFDTTCIFNAITRAQEAVQRLDSDLAHMISIIVQDKFHGQEGDMSVEEIQHLVEKQLISADYEVGHAYITYRYEQDRTRDKYNSFIRDINNLVSLKDKSITNENANKDARVFPVQRDLIAGIVAKHFAKNHILSEKLINAHDSGDIHIHDLDYSPFLSMTNCCLVDLKSLLGNGFKLGNAQIESPKSFGVACAVMAQITAQVASHQYGGTTLANIDQVLELYACKSFDKHLKNATKFGIEDDLEYASEMTSKEIYDGIQAFEYEINTLFTTNGQTPFVTLTFGMGTGWFCKEIQKALLKVRIKGLGKDGITAVFPKLVMFLDEGINLKPEDPNYDIKQLALECASKRLYPDIISAKNNRRITGSSVPVSPMGCRAFLSSWKDEQGNEVLDGRNNLGVVSLNLPRVAIESQGNMDKFWSILDQKLELCKEAIDVRLDTLRGVKASVAPILYTEGAFGVRLHSSDDIFSIFRNGRASISLGYIGVHETMLQMFKGFHPLDNKDAQAFAFDVIKKLKETVLRWKHESPEGIGYTLYSTPSESLCDRFCRLDAARFGILHGITDKGWYTNSFHLDVDKKVSPFEKIDFEAKFHEIANGGHISYAEFPNIRHNLKALEAVWDYAMEHLDYFGTNTPSDRCFSCGFEGEFSATSKGFTCPNCGNHDSEKMSIIRRVCGYLGSPNSRGFNAGKQAEVEHRVKHM